MKSVKLIITLFVLMALQSINAQKAAINTVVTGPYSNKVSDFAYSGQVVVTYDGKGYCCWDNQYAALTITNTTTGAVFKTKAINRIALSLGRASATYVLSTSDLSNLLSPYSWDITGLSTAEETELKSNGTLPDGIYSFCFEYWASMSVNPVADETDQTSNYCAYNINISKSAQLISVLPVMSRPMTERSFSWFKNATNLSITSSSNIRTYYNVSMYMKLTGPGGVSVSTKAQKCTTLQKFTVSPTSPYIATTSDLQSWFNETDLDATGINFADDVLPDGNYQLCLIAHSMSTNCAEELSDPNLACLNFTVQADPVHFTLSATPVTSNKISAIRNNQISALMTSQSKYSSVRIGIRIKGDNGVEIATKLGSVMPGPTYTLNANVPVSLSSLDLDYLFDINNMQVISGINPSVFLSNGELPDGTYELCFEGFDASNNKVSASGGTNCELPFSFGSGGGITSLYEAPIIVAPVCGDSARATYPQTLVFNWLTPSSFNVQNRATPQQYVLRIVEMLEFQDAWDAVRKATTPFFFEKTVTGNNYIYGIGNGDPLLERGKKYAFYVQIFDKRSSYRNDGKSDVCWFSWGGTTTDTTKKIINNDLKKTKNINTPVRKIEIINPVCGNNPIKDNQMYVQWKPLKNEMSASKGSNLKSDLTKSERYLFEIREAIIQKGKSADYNSLKIAYTEYTTDVFVQNNASLLKLKDKHTYYFKVYKEEGGQKVAESEPCMFIYKFIPPPIKPKGNITFKGQIVYTAKGRDGEFVPPNLSITVKEIFYIADKTDVNNAKYTYYNNPLTGEPGKVWEINTDIDGFINSKLDIENIGIVKDNYSFTSKNFSTSGVLIHAITIKTNNIYYKQIDATYSSATDNVIDIGKLFTTAYTFDLTVKVKKGYKSDENVQENCPDCQVTLSRSNPVPGMPLFRRQGDKVEAVNLTEKYKLVEYAFTEKVNNNGKEETQVVFKNLLNTKFAAHKYIITLQKEGYEKGTEITATYNTSKTVEVTYLSDKLPKSKVSGQIFYTYKGTNTALPLNTTLLLKVCYVMEKDGKKFVINRFNFEQQGEGALSFQIIDAFNKAYPDNEKSLGWTTSNSSGEFTFNVENPNTYNSDLLDYQTSGGGGEFKYYFTGKIYRCLRVVVNNGYYTNPDKDIFIEPLQTVNVGKITATVRAMDIKIKCTSIKLENQAVVSGGPVPGLDVGIMRKGPVQNYFPQNEGNIYKEKNVPDSFKNNPKYISYGQTNANGELILKDVVINKGKDFEKLFLFAQSPELKGEFNYFGFKEINVEEWTLHNKNPTFEPDAVFNSDFFTPTLEVEVKMIPLTPMLRGRVLDVSKSNTGLKNATAMLSYQEITYKEKKKKTLFGEMGTGEYEKFVNVDIKAVLTDNDGYFELPVKVHPAIQGAEQSQKLKVSKPGYYYGDFLGIKYDYETDLGLLSIGSQKVLPEIYLKPRATIKGNVTDESGNAVDCYVGVLGSDLKEAFYLFMIGGNSFSSYEVMSPPGKNIKLVVWPKDLKYFIDTLTIANVAEGENKFNIVVKKRLHRFAFKVQTVITEKKGAVYADKIVAVKDAKIEIEGNTATTDAGGAAFMSFYNTSTKNFTAKITGADGTSFIDQYANITNYETKSGGTVTTITLKKGRTVSGKVTLAGKPFKGAVVVEDKAAGLPPNEAVTDAEGNYVLGGLNTTDNLNITLKVYVPSELQTKGTTIIGKEEKVNLQGSYGKTINFNLEELNSDLNNFYGFKLDVTSVKKLPNDVYSVNGYVHIDESNTHFIPKEGNKMAFSDLKFKYSPATGGGISLSTTLPLDDKITTDKLAFNAKYGKNINAMYASPLWLFGTPLEIVKNSENSAEMKGIAYIVDNSFDFPGSYLSFGKTMFFFGEQDKKGLDKVLVSGVTSKNKKNKKYNLCDAYGKSLKYKFLQFEAESDPDKSFIEVANSEAKLSMATKIYAKFDNITPSNLEIDLGVFEMNHEKIFPLTGKQNIKFALEQWTVEVKNWQITTDKGGITSNEGFVVAGAVNVPFKYFHMQNNLLKFDDFNLKDVSLGNVVNLKIGTGTTPIFGFDQATGTDKKPHWKMTLVGNGQNPAASFGGIEGLPKNKMVKIEVLTLTSNGEQLLSFGANAEPLLLYEVVKFSPNSISSYSDYFTMGGILDLNMPRFNNALNGIVKVTKSGSGGKVEILPQQYEFEGKGFVKFKSLGTAEQSQKIEQGKLTLYATVEEPGKTPLFKCKLEKLGYEGAATITLLENQKVPFGTQKLSKVKGSMNVVSGDWDYLRFEGDLEGFDGVAQDQKHLAFTVYGDIKAEGQTVKMDNIKTPFGGMEITYDLQKNQLVGHMDVDMDWSESLTVKGVANMLFDKGGFIIGVSAQVTAPVVNTFNAGLLLGTYTNIPQNFLTDVVKYNYNKNIPCHIKEQGLTGFFITGARQLPLQVPTFNIDIPPGLSLVTIYAGATSGIEVQLAMNFKGGFKLDANILAYAHAWAGCGSVTCTEAKADATAELLVKGNYENGNFYIDGCGSIKLMVSGKQSMPPFCSAPSIELGTTLGAKYLIHLGSDGFSQGVEFSMGESATNCSAMLNCK